MRTKSIFLLVVAFLVSQGFPLKADVIIGLPAVPNQGNCIPFSCAGFFQLNTYQQVYSAGAFSGPVDITGIDFFDTQILPNGTVDSGTYTLSLSYTSKPVGGLDLSNPANNSTSGAQVFFSGSLPNFVGGMLDFVGAPFIYDPTLGNLLLTVSISGATDNGLVFFDQAQSLTDTTRAFFGGAVTLEEIILRG